MADRVHQLRWYFVGALCIPLLAGCALLLNNRIDDPEPLAIAGGDAPPADVRVYITGAVERPGVYPLSENARWIDALEAAGGAAADADLAGVNLAQKARDEDQIVVPRIGNDTAVAEAAAGPTVVNINTADQEELESLPGIGEVRAGRIIASREADGPFEQVEDVLLRDLVPDSVYQEIEPLIAVD